MSVLNTWHLSETVQKKMQPLQGATCRFYVFCHPLLLLITGSLMFFLRRKWSTGLNEWVLLKLGLWRFLFLMVEDRFHW